MIQRILGLMLTLFSVTMLPPALVALGYGDGQADVFVASFAIIAATGLLLWLPARSQRRDLRLRDGFLIVALFWVCLGLAGAVPLLLTEAPAMNFTDAVFEAVSGVTTTGATVITGLDALPRSILYYRQQIQWLGGIGIIVLAVALLPMLGIGGMQLYRAETPGPVKDQKLTPRIAQTAKALWAVYVLLTAVCAGCYYLAGMDAFDAIAHSFSTIATAGFSPHDASFAYFNNYGLDMIATVFMFLGGASFALHFTFLRKGNLALYWREPEFQAYFWLVVATIIVATFYLLVAGTYAGPAESFRHAAFQVVSLLTGTGFVTTAFVDWPGAMPVLLMLIAFIGGCAGSTTGGMKVIRWLLVFKQALVELRRLVHPNAVLPVRVGGRPMPQQVITGVAGFFAIYFIVFGVMMMMLMVVGVDQVTAWSAIASSLNNVGPALGEVAAHFQNLPTFGKWVCIVAMIAGRLEIFTLVLLLTPAFWRN